MKTTIIVAADVKGGIGLNGVLPWRLPSDLRRFKSVTMDHVLVCGSNTFRGFNTGLPGRICVVMTRKPKCCGGRFVEVGWEPESALSFASGLEGWAQRDNVFVIGGARVYEALLPFADEVLVTRLHQAVEADTFFPQSWLAGFKQVRLLDHETHPDDQCTYSIECYERR